MKELKISAIREGTVIDHIPAKYTFKIAEILDINGHDNIVSIASNLKSKKLGMKGIIKVGGLNLKEKDAKKIALMSSVVPVSREAKPAQAEAEKISTTKAKTNKIFFFMVTLLYTGGFYFASETHYMTCFFKCRVKNISYHWVGWRKISLSGFGKGTKEI